MKKQGLVNWSDPALERWINTITKASTKYVYKSAYRAYAQFTGMTASALIDEALEDAKRDPRMRRDVVLQKLIGFYNWCKTEYPRKTRGRGEHTIIGKGALARFVVDANSLIIRIGHGLPNAQFIVQLKGFAIGFDNAICAKTRRKSP